MVESLTMISQIVFPVVILFAGGYLFYLIIKLLMMISDVTSVKNIADNITSLDNRIKNISDNLENIDHEISHSIENRLSNFDRRLDEYERLKSKKYSMDENFDDTLKK